MPSTEKTTENCSEPRDDLLARYQRVRQQTEQLAAPLSPEDCVIQTMPDVSPTRWHLAHLTWFFETFVLKKFVPGYDHYHPAYAWLFNSYYNGVGPQFPRARRGTQSRPSVGDIFDYRAYVDEAVAKAWDQGRLGQEAATVIELGLHHEQQHQELMLMDIKHVLSCNPLDPVYRHDLATSPVETGSAQNEFHHVKAGIYQIGHQGDGFGFDSESPRHRVLLEDFALAKRPITCGQYLEFMEDGGYQRHDLWLSDGWDRIQEDNWRAPLYWTRRDHEWRVFTLGGLRKLRENEPVCHVSYYEADAFATWAGGRLPTEAQWEAAAQQEDTPDAGGNFLETDALHPLSCGDGLFGNVWQWTSSDYAPYPGFAPKAGALGEYNGKFMINQRVLRGGCCVTPADHIRASYRNFYFPHQRWMFSGIRLAKDAS